MTNPTSSNINKHSNISVNIGEGFIYITSIVKDTNMTIGGVAVADTVKAQEFYSLGSMVSYKVDECQANSCGVSGVHCLRTYVFC